MSACGYFGKAPIARDFILNGLPARMIDDMAQRMSLWVVASRGEQQDPLIASPVWRFIVNDTMAGHRGWLGLMAGSIDSVGREFPFTVMLPVPVTARHELVPHAQLDKVLDEVEPHMLAFLEGFLPREAFSDLLASVARRLHGVAEVSSVRSQDRQILLGPADLAACFVGTRPAWNASACAVIHSLPGHGGKNLSKTTGKNADAAGYSFWWHEDDTLRSTELFVTRGYPEGQCAVPFFRDDWARQDWQSHEPQSYWKRLQHNNTAR